MTDFLGHQLGNYRLIRLLGQGGFADVYLGEHIHLGTYAAVKVLKTQVAAEDIERFRNEARLIANLKNLHTVPVLDFGIQNGTPFLVMEYAVNGTLRQRHPRGSMVAPERIVTYVNQVAAALQYAHDRHVIHRDVKPENILQAPDDKVWLSDFGIALIAQSTQASMQDMAGSFLYIAPEQIEGHPRAASDQYSLAVVVYEWLCGTTPFTGPYTELAMQHLHAPPPPLLQKVPGLAPAVEAVVFKALTKDPKQRFARVQDFAEDLERACQFTKRASPPPPPVTEAAILGPAGRMVLGPTVLTIGRRPDNQLVLNDSQVSGHHAVIRQQGQGYAITDMGSRNGTFVNGQLLTTKIPRLLNAGDTIRIGTTQMTYEARSMARFEDKGHTVWAPPSPVPPVPPPPPPKPWWRRTREIIAVNCAAILILISIIAIPVAISNSQAANATATAQANNAAATVRANSAATMATVQANNAAATATAQASNNPATATATALQNLYTSATNGNPAFNDPLSSNNNGWSEGNSSVPGSSCKFTNGAYHVSVARTSDLHFCDAGSAFTFSNFAYQLQMTIVSGDEGCIIFRYTSANNGRYYAFCIGSDGNYKFIRADNHYVVLRNSSSSAITTGLNQMNTVTVIAQGAELDMYVNQQFVVPVNDTNYTQGLIGVGALDNTNSTEVVFSNVQVWTL